MRSVTRSVAFDPAWWTPAQAAEVRELFDTLATGWNERFAGGDEHAAVIRDALSRGGVPRGGRVLEIGSGTGLATIVLAPQFDVVVALDLSFEMLCLAPPGSGPRVHGDAAALPFAPVAFEMIVLVNALLFPSEVERCLTRDGAVLWISSIGADTPIYLSAADVGRALPGSWHAVTADAGSGTWTVLRRS
jgi:SAM-dependent methyltransferase